MAPEVVGRDEELAVVAAFVHGALDGPTVFVLEGEAGIGKSTLWQAGVDRARSEGLRVLAVRPAEAELGLGHAGLGDLVDGVVDEVLPSLAVPRRRALEAALLRDVSAEPVDDRALAVAVRDVLQRLARAGPLVVAIDDVQWLDRQTAATLAFALRRLGAAQVLVLLARRVGAEGPPLELERAVAPERVSRLRIGPLSVGALHRVLLDRLDRPFARQTLLRIHEHCGGNPFFALEVARVLREDVDPFAPLPVSETLDDLLRVRMAGLPSSTRDALALASALGTTPESLLRRAGIASDALDPALAAHVVERDEGVVRFAHPLLASVLYRSLGDSRRSIHARLAALLDDPLLRARHVALSTEAPDRDAAELVFGASTLALERGAAAVSAELAEHALRLTPADAPNERRRRALAAAHANQAAGEWTRARSLATDVLGATEAGPWRAQALVLLAELAAAEDSAALLEEALEAARDDPALRSAIYCRLAWAARFRSGVDYAGQALALAEQLGDDVLQARARVVQAVLGWFHGEPAAGASLAIVAPDLAGAVGGDRLVQEATQAIVNTLAPAERPRAARTRVRRVARARRAAGGPRFVGPRLGRVLRPVASSSRPPTPLVHTTSRSSTASRCRRTTCPSPSLRSTGATSTWPVRIRSELWRWPRRSSASTLPSTPR